VGDNVFSASRNPELWISPPQGQGLLVGRLIQTNGNQALRVPVKIRSLEGNGNYDIISYAEGAVNRDEYYQENLVLGDLPAGKYLLVVDEATVAARTEVTIYPGQVTFFTYNNADGISFERPTPTVPPYVPQEPTPAPSSTLTP